MTTSARIEQEHLQEEEALRRITGAAQVLEELTARLGKHVRRAEVRSRLERYLRGLLAPVGRKNGWQMAEALGEANAHGVQRLLQEAEWDEQALRDELCRYVIEHLAGEQGVLVVDETGFLKKGKKSAGVASQYSGAAGGTANCQIGVFLLYASSKGQAFIDRELYLPQEWTQDRVRCREAGIPEEVAFATKGQLAQQMLARAFAAGVPAQWVVGDTIYGSDELRLWLEAQHKHALLAVPETHLVWVAGRQQPVGLLAALLPASAWVVLSAGEGSKGARRYEWAWLQLPERARAGRCPGPLGADPALALRPERAGLLSCVWASRNNLSGTDSRGRESLAN
nr:IS701 family transposase [Ktedonobacter racemifer]